MHIWSDLRSVDLPALLLTLVLAAAGGLVAYAIGLPLGLLLGATVATGVAAAVGFRPLGRAIMVPPTLRFAFVPVIGVAIGGAFTPEVAQQALGWGWSLAALCVFVPLSHVVGYAIYRTGGLPPMDAFFGAVPGGLIESVALGEEAGADVRILTALQFLRLILTIISVPLVFWLLTGAPVGSSSGMAMTGADVPLGLRDVLVLLVAGLAGVWLGGLARLPAAIMTGPILLSALAHVTGLVEGVPPQWMIGVTQVVVGAGLGARFSGINRATLWRALKLAVVNAAAALLLAFGFAFALRDLLAQQVAAVFLAFAPGGLAEMSLIALSLQMSVIYVTVHHVLRIVIAVMVARIGARWVA